MAGDNVRRKCLRCLKGFRSKHIGNRICSRCKDSAAYRESVELEEYGVIR